MRRKTTEWGMVLDLKPTLLRTHKTCTWLRSTSFFLQWREVNRADLRRWTEAGFLRMHPKGLRKEL